MKDQEQIGTHVSRGLAWIGMASSLVGLLDFVAIVLLLAFWIPAEQYGIATKAVWIFPILDQITDMGLSAAVIQREQHDDDVISTVFWINLTVAALLFLALLLIAPIVAISFYEDAIVGWMLIAYGTKLLWQNVYFIPSALMRRELRFKELSVIRIIANLAEFAAKIGFAAAGFGIWCFVLAPLCRVFVTGVGCQIRHPWRPRFVLRLRKAWDYATFGLKTSASQILFNFYTNVDYPVVGYYFGNYALGLYRGAFEVVLEPVKIISHVVVDIAFPTFAKLRHARERLIAQFISFTRLNLITVMTYSVLVFVAAEDVLAVVFPQYTEAVDAVRILCAVAVFRSVSFVVPPLLDGMGYPTRTFVYTLTAAITLPLCYIAGANLLGDELGYRSVAVAWVVGYPIAFAVLVVIALVTVELPVLRYLRAVMGIPACAVAAGLAAAGVQFVAADLPSLLRLALTVAALALVMGFLLAHTQGLRLATAMKALKGSGAIPPDAVGADGPPPEPVISDPQAPVEPPLAGPPDDDAPPADPDADRDADRDEPPSGG